MGFSKLNDRTLRVVLAEYHRIIEQDRWLLTIPQVCMPIWQDFIDYAVMSGALKAPDDFLASREAYSAVSCHPEGWPILHELLDANVAVVRLKAGLTSRKRELADQAIDVRDVDEERTEDAARSKEKGRYEDYESGRRARRSSRAGSERRKPELRSPQRIVPTLPKAKKIAEAITQEICCVKNLGKLMRVCGGSGSKVAIGR